MTEKNELTVVETAKPLMTIEPVEYVAQVFEPFAKRLADAKALAVAAEFDVTTTAGMAVAVKHRATFREIRVASEKARKERKAPILEIGKLLDSRQKEIEAEIEPFESRFDAAIKAEEGRKEIEKQAKAAAETARIAFIRKRIGEIQAIPSESVGRSAADLAATIELTQMMEITLEEFGEFAGECEMVKVAAVTKLGEMLAAQQAHEAEQARIASEREALARERAEAAERERVASAEREAQAKKDREALAARQAEIAEQERKAATARAEQEAKDRAERERVETEQRAAQERAAAAMRAEREAHEAAMAKQRAELAAQQAEIDRAKAEQERIAREAREAAEAAARAEAERIAAEQAAAAQAEADRIFAEQQRIEAERRAAEMELIRREQIQFELNGPGEADIVRVLAEHFDVNQQVALSWIINFDLGSPGLVEKAA